MEIIRSFVIRKIINFDKKTNIPYSFIFLDEELRKRYRKYLILKGFKEINIEEINDEEKKICEKEYINSIADLGFEYNSIQWWANSVSEKNEHISSHYRNLCLYYSLIKTLEKYLKTDMHIFIVCNNEIYEQLKIYCNCNHIKIISLEKVILLRLRKIYEKSYIALRIILSLMKILLRKIYISYTLENKIKKKIDKTGNYYVIRTWFDNRFLEQLNPYHDAYFGELPEYVMKQGHKLLILAGIINNYKKTIRKIKNIENMLIIPEEYFLKYLDFFRLLLYLHSKKVKLTERVLFNNLDMTKLYETEISKGYFNAGYYKNILRYFIAKRFTQNVKFKTYIQTFENYAWEKMTILGIRESKPEGEILAFQHAFISRNSFKYFPGKAEKDVMPLPDKIINMGKATKDIMGKYGSYNQNILKIGCALRQEYLSKLKPFRRRRVNKIVVPLTMVRKESILIMNFLYNSGLSQTKLKVIIRCHPASPFESFQKYIEFKIPNNFIISNEKSIIEELSEADGVIYTWTTVAVEALKLGLPVIYLDILTPMYVDPIFECNALKKNVYKPEELLPAIEYFYNMDDEIFFKEQETSQKYLKEYFYSVTEENLAPFLPA